MVVFSAVGSAIRDIRNRGVVFFAGCMESWVLWRGELTSLLDVLPDGWLFSNSLLGVIGGCIFCFSPCRQITEATGKYNCYQYHSQHMKSP